MLPPRAITVPNGPPPLRTLSIAIAIARFINSGFASLALTPSLRIPVVYRHVEQTRFSLPAPRANRNARSSAQQHNRHSRLRCVMSRTAMQTTLQALNARADLE